MTTRGAPDLPTGYEEIWQLLSNADRKAPSRRVLAGDIGIATQTLQRLLVTGDVPRFRDRANPREVKAWVRTLSRLARYFGRDPREWIEAVGILWDSGVADAVEKARHVARPTAPSRRRDPVADIRRQATPTVRIGLLRYHHFAAPLPSTGASFLERYSERLVRSIDPMWRVEFVPSSIETLLDDLTSDGYRCHLVAALFDTVERRSRGLRFLPIPGWEVRHSAITIRERGAPRPIPRWQDVTERWYPGAFFVVVKQQAAHSFLHVQCGLPASAFETLTQSSRWPDAASALLDITSAHPDREVIYVNEEESCLQLMETLNGRAGFSERYEVAELAGAPEECPSYPLSFAVRADAEDWHRLLAAAQESEVHGNAEIPTARLYAEVMARGVLAHLPPGAEEPIETRSAWSPQAFPSASVRFQLEVAQHLVHTLDQGLAGADEALAVLQAERLLPAGWRRLLPRAAASPDDDVRAQPCESCGSFLGAVPSARRYCPQCGGDDDRLRSRGNIRDALVDRYLAWQPDVGRGEAERRADQLLEVMPAWQPRR